MRSVATPAAQQPPEQREETFCVGQPAPERSEGDRTDIKQLPRHGCRTTYPESASCGYTRRRRRHLKTDVGCTTSMPRGFKFAVNIAWCYARAVVKDSAARARRVRPPEVHPYVVAKKQSL